MKCTIGGATLVGDRRPRATVTLTHPPPRHKIGGRHHGPGRRSPQPEIATARKQSSMEAHPSWPRAWRHVLPLADMGGVVPCLARPQSPECVLTWVGELILPSHEGRPGWWTKSGALGTRPGCACWEGRPRRTEDCARPRGDVRQPSFHLERSSPPAPASTRTGVDGSRQ